MEYFDLIYKECNRLNSALTNRSLQCYFISASLTQIIYGAGKNVIVFDYNPNRYEYGKAMILKGLTIRLDSDSKRSYSMIQVLSFMENNCNSFSDDNKTLPLDQLLDKYNLFLEQSQKNIGWEDKYKKYLKERYPW